MKDRVVVHIGVVAAIVAVIAVNWGFVADSWQEMPVALLVAVIALAVLNWAIGKPPQSRPGAPTNTQLQDPPPAIHHDSK